MTSKSFPTLLLTKEITQNGSSLNLLPLKQGDLRSDLLTRLSEQALRILLPKINAKLQSQSRTSSFLWDCSSALENAKLQSFPRSEILVLFPLKSLLCTNNDKLQTPRYRLSTCSYFLWESFSAKDPDILSISRKVLESGDPEYPLMRGSNDQQD